MPVVPAVVPNPLVPIPVAVPVVLAGVPPNEKPPVLQYVKNVKCRNIFRSIFQFIQESCTIPVNILNWTNIFGHRSAICDLQICEVQNQKRFPLDSTDLKP